MKKLQEYLSFKTESENKRNELMLEVDKELIPFFDNHPLVKKALTDIDSSKEYTIDQYGDLYLLASLNLSEFKKDDLVVWLDRYFSNETDYTLDIEYEAILNFQGDDYIAVSDDGDIYQSSKCIIKKSDYDSETERNELIEAHMEKTGCFPGVFSIDHYGNVTFIDTTKKENENA